MTSSLVTYFSVVDVSENIHRSKKCDCYSKFLGINTPMVIHSGLFHLTIHSCSPSLPPKNVKNIVFERSSVNLFTSSISEDLHLFI